MFDVWPPNLWLLVAYYNIPDLGLVAATAMGILMVLSHGR